MPYYETPSTPQDFTDLLAEIYWPMDCNEQAGAIANLLAVMEAVQRGLNALVPVRLHVISDLPPGAADWEEAWVRSGRTLPLTGSVIGLWETATEETKDTAQYAWIENAMRPTLARWWNGSSEFLLTTPGMYTNALSASATLPTTSYAEYITQPLALKRDAYIHAAYGYTETSDPAVNYIQWRSSVDGASDVRSTLRGTTAGLLKRTPQLRLTPAAKLSNGTTLRVYLKLNVGGTDHEILFKNTAGTRKAETGLHMATSPATIKYPSEVSALATEAIYLI